MRVGSVMMLVVACARPPAAVPAPASPACAGLSADACYASSTCLLDAQGGCREPATDCERGFVQADPATCGAGCVLVAEPCFCPPGVVCVCGGGAPPACVTP